MWKEASTVEYDEIDEGSQEREWQEAAAAAALRAGTSGHVDNLEVVRGLLTSAELALVMNEAIVPGP